MHMKPDYPEPFEKGDAPRSVGDSRSPAEEPGAARRRALILAATGALAFILAVMPLFAVPVPATANQSVRTDAQANAASGTVLPAPVLIQLAETAAPDAGGSVQISRYAQLHIGDDYPAVQQLQSQLTALGYLDADEPSTVYNAALADAVSMFQRAHGMEINGEADAVLQDALFNDAALSYRVALGDEGDDVASLQTALAALGYFSGKATGYFGTATEVALLRFQRAHGMIDDGSFDADDRETLYSPQARPAEQTAAPAPTDTPPPAKRPAEPPTAPASEAAPAVSDAGAVGSVPLTPPPLMSGNAVEPPADTPPPEAAPAEEASDADAAAGEDATVGEDEPASDGSGAPDAVEGVIATALAQLGKPYQRGAEGPRSYDCSGLVYYCLTQNGIRIGRYSAASYAKVSGWKKITRMGNLQRGDLIFYHGDDSSRVSHVGICLGDGTMIDASSNKSQIVHRSHTTAYWESHFVCGRRAF